MIGSPEYKWRTLENGLVVPDLQESWATEVKGEFREPIKAQVVKENARTMWVKLDDGSIIKRKKGKQIEG